MAAPHNPWDKARKPFVGYILVCGSAGEIEEKVRKHLEVGWLPQGGVVVLDRPRGPFFYQAMFHPDWDHPDYRRRYRGHRVDSPVGPDENEDRS